MHKNSLKKEPGDLQNKEILKLRQTPAQMIITLTGKPVQRGGGLKKRGEEEAAVKSGGSMRKGKKRGWFTWTGGGEHGQGVGVMVPPAISLNKLLLTL